MAASVTGNRIVIFNFTETQTFQGSSLPWPVNPTDAAVQKTGITTGTAAGKVEVVAVAQCSQTGNTASTPYTLDLTAAPNPHGNVTFTRPKCLLIVNNATGITGAVTVGGGSNPFTDRIVSVAGATVNLAPGGCYLIEDWRTSGLGLVDSTHKIITLTPADTNYNMKVTIYVAGNIS